MPLSTHLPSVAGLLAAVNLSSAQVSGDLIKHLETAKRLAMTARVRATIRVSIDDGVGHKESGSYAWAYAAGSEHVRSLPGSQLAPGEESVWDGNRGMMRPGFNTPPLPPNRNAIQVTRTWGTYILSPIRDSYITEIGGSHPLQSWVVDIIKLPKTNVESAQGGRVRLQVPAHYTGGNRIVEINPRWGYMIDLVREVNMSGPDRLTGKRIVASMQETRVMEARNVGGCWIPTRTEARTVLAPGSRINKRVTELLDISTSVQASEFSPLGEPGDTIVDGSSTLSCQPKGPMGANLAGKGRLVHSAPRGILCNFGRLRSRGRDRVADPPSRPTLRRSLGSARAWPERTETIDHALRSRHLSPAVT